MSELEGNKIKEYWDKRSTEQGERTVGFGNQPISVQENNYRKRYEFIIPYLDREVMVLDYGCGIGRYTAFFKPEKYIGVDVCCNLLNIAEKNNPDYKFAYIPQGLLEFNKTIEPIQFIFTATVLQHNSDRQVLDIFKSWKPYLADSICFVFYENCHNANDTKHIAFRQPDKYMELISRVFSVADWTYDKHIIHGEEHAIMKFYCLNS